MELLHSQEEIKFLESQMELASELTKLATKYNNKTIGLEAEVIRINNQKELDKYNHLIGTECYAPPSSFTGQKEYRKGKIESISHFNNYSRSVRVKFRYSDGEFDGHSLKELKEQA